MHCGTGDSVGSSVVAVVAGVFAGCKRNSQRHNHQYGNDDSNYFFDKYLQFFYLLLLIKIVQIIADPVIHYVVVSGNHFDFEFPEISSFALAYLSYVYRTGYATHIVKRFNQRRDGKSVSCHPFVDIGGGSVQKFSAVFLVVFFCIFVEFILFLIRDKVGREFSAKFSLLRV